jgi:hypothetical protein
MSRAKRVAGSDCDGASGKSREQSRAGRKAEPAGTSGWSPRPSSRRPSSPESLARMPIPIMNRRIFLAALGALGLAPLAGCGGDGGGGAAVDTTLAYKLSTRGRRVSNAAKSNAANKLFVSSAAAAAGRAHPGDRSRIVRVNVSSAFWMTHFGAGQAFVDLRHV